MIYSNQRVQTKCVKNEFGRRLSGFVEVKAQKETSPSCKSSDDERKLAHSASDSESRHSGRESSKNKSHRRYRYRHIVVKEIAVSVIHRIHLGKDIINDFVFIFPPCTYNVKILSVSQIKLNKLYLIVTAEKRYPRGDGDIAQEAQIQRNTMAKGVGPLEGNRGRGTLPQPLKKSQPVNEAQPVYEPKPIIEAQPVNDVQPNNEPQSKTRPEYYR